MMCYKRPENGFGMEVKCEKRGRKIPVWNVSARVRCHLNMYDTAPDPAAAERI